MRRTDNAGDEAGRSPGAPHLLIGDPPTPSLLRTSGISDTPQDPEHEPGSDRLSELNSTRWLSPTSLGKVPAPRC
jgi:hypothetical protein